MPWKAEILIYVFKFIFKFHVNSLLEPGNEGVQEPVKQLRWSSSLNCLKPLTSFTKSSILDV